LSRFLRVFDFVVAVGLVGWLAVCVVDVRGNVDFDDKHYAVQLQSLVGGSVAYRRQALFLEGFSNFKQPGFALVGWLSWWVVRAAGVTERRVELPFDDYQHRQVPPTVVWLWDTAGVRFFDARGRVVWDWTVIWALALTTMFAVAGGLVAMMWTLAARAGPLFVAPLLLVSSRVFMHNLVGTPLYPTGLAFGLAAGFVWLLLGVAPSRLRVLAAGVVLGVLVLVRIEAVLFVPCALVLRRRDLVGVFLLGLVPAVVMQLGYDWLKFGSVWDFPTILAHANRIGLSWVWIRAGVSSLAWVSPLFTLGLGALLVSGRGPLRVMAFASLAVVVLALVRLPTQIAISPELAYFDVNRYVVLAYPAGALGLGLLWTGLVRRLTARATATG